MSAVSLFLYKFYAMIKAVIFDMDGLLIDSEPIWRLSEIKVFRNRGIHINEDDCRGTTGMRLDEVVAHWAFKFPEAKLDFKSTEKAIMDEVCNLVADQGAALPGVMAAIDFFEMNNSSPVLRTPPPKGDSLRINL